MNSREIDTVKNSIGAGRQGQLQQQLVELDAEITKIKEVISELDGRLTPLQRPEPKSPLETKDTGVARPILCPVAEGIYNMRQQLQQLSSQLLDILRLLEV